MTRTRFTRTLATGLAGVALAATAGAPVASAMPADPVRMPESPGIVPPYDIDDPVADVAPAEGFDFAAAGLGAGAAGLLALIGGGLMWRRPRTHRHGAAGI